MGLQRTALVRAGITLSILLGAIVPPIFLHVPSEFQGAGQQAAGGEAGRPAALMAIDRSPLQLRPQEASSLLSVGLMHLTHEGLFTPAAEGGVRAALCQTMWHDTSCREWGFTIRPARWSDGSLLQARDFVRAILRAHDPGQPCVAAAAVAPLDWGGAHPAAEAPDASTLILRWRDPTPQAPSLLAMPAFFPLAPPDRGAIGNGPYTLLPLAPGRGLKLCPSETYRFSTAHLPILRLLAMDQRAALAAALDGQVDWIGSPWGASQIGVTKEPLGGWQEAIFWGRHWLRMNTRHSELASHGLRQSIRDAICRGSAPMQPPIGLVERPRPGVANRLEPAPRFCGSAFSMLFAPSHLRDMQAALLQQWLHRAGVEVELCPVEPKTLAKRVADGDYQLVLSSWVAESPLPDEMLKPWLAAQAPGNSTGWHAEETDEQQEGRRRGSLTELVSLESLVLDGAAVVPISPMVMRSWNSPLLRGWRLTPLGSFDLHSMGLSEQSSEPARPST